MKQVVIGCSVIRKEIEYYLEQPEGFTFIWLEDHLHNTPDILHAKVQQAIDDHVDADCIYLLYGHCGQALCGIEARHCPVVLPKVEDCIEMMLKDVSAVEAMRSSSYFVSQGWLWGKENLGYEYDRMKEKYGAKRADRVIKAMYKNYQHLVYINTGVEEERVRGDCQAVADRLDLELKEVEGTVDLLLKMLKGQTDTKVPFICIQPGEQITEALFRY